MKRNTIIGFILGACATVLIAQVGVNSGAQPNGQGLSWGSSMGSPWKTVVQSTSNAGYSADGPETADAATVTNANYTTDTVAGSALNTRTGIRRENYLGTYLILRLAYNDDASATTSPVVKVFGRFGSGDAWQVLRNQAGAITGTLTIDTTNDATDGTYKYTTPHTENNAWDVAGCIELRVVVETAFNSAGTENDSTIQGRIF